jgi:FkbM family methyltransferase
MTVERPRPDYLQRSDKSERKTDTVLDQGQEWEHIMYHLYKWTRQSAARNTMTHNYEPMQPHLLMALARRFECDTFLDIGANIGAYSILMTGVPSIQSIHAFEASPETFGHLKRNVELNHSDIAIYNKAASDQLRVLKFGIVNTLSGANSVIEGSLHKNFEREIEVEAEPLDEALHLHDRRLCIKIDVEGHEPQVIAGMKKLLEGNAVVLQVEDYSKTPGELENRLKAHGLTAMFRVGVDRYFTNVKPAPTPEEQVEIFQQAAEALVTTNLGARQQSYVGGESPVDLSFGRTATLQLRGRSANWARKLRSLVRSATGR